MKRSSDVLTGAAVGAGLMYLLDPERGRRRRSILRDQMVHLTHVLNAGAGTTARDLGNRTRGVVAEAGSHFRSADAGDAVLRARVRAMLGRLVSHPGAIQVQVDDGHVMLSGPVLTDEVKHLLAGVRAVRGVKEVKNQLLVYDTPGDVPGLQGRSRRPQHRPELLQENWAPATRLLMGILGGALALRGVRRSGPLNALGSLLGLGLLSRAVSNLTFKRLVGVHAGSRAVDVHKIVNVEAPREEVFSFWADYENFPQFMSHLREVRATGDGRSHWVAEGPAGLSIAWDAETTVFIPNEVIAWKSLGDSSVQSAGIVRFEQNPDGSTRVGIRMSYNPPGGALGHALAWLVGADALQLLSDDLVRFKSLLELGKTSAHGHRVTRGEIAAASRASSG